MQALIGTLFMVAALALFYFSATKEGKPKIVPMRAVAVVFGVIGFYCLLKYARAANMPEVAPPYLFYIAAAVILSVGDVIVGLSTKWFCYVFRLER